MLIKIKDHRIVASKVISFHWKSGKKSEQKEDRLIIETDYDGYYLIEGPKTLLGMFEKQYNDIMNND